MKTEWRPKTYKQFPGWGCRRIVTGGYKTSHKTTVYVRCREPNGHWGIRAELRYIHAPLLVRYEINFNGALFFSVATRKQALPLIRKYNKELTNA